MGFLSKIFGTDFETQKKSVFEEIERQCQHDAQKMSLAKATWLSMRGNNLANHRNFEQALKDFKEALEFEPSRVSTLVSLGGVYTDKGMHKEAIVILEKAESLLKPVDDSMYNITSHNLYYTLGHAYFFIDNKEKAVQCLIRSLEAVEKQRILRERGLIAEEEWKKEQRMFAPMIKNTKWLLARIRL